MKAFVTGATGFVGAAVARELAAGGAELRLLVRRSSNTANIDDLLGERAVGDLRDPGSLKKAIAGCDAVFHVAADYRLWVRDPEEMYRANVEGTRALIEAALGAGVKRVVVTSSVATMGFIGDGTPVTEESPVSERDMIGHYKRSKYLGEQVALEYGRKGAPVVVVNPTAPVGERDIKPTPTGRILLDFLNRKFPAYMDTGLNAVDVREVARGHVLALERARPGERYILGGEDLTLKQLLDKLSALSGIPAPTKKVPHGVAMCFATVNELFVGRLLGGEPRATREAVRMGKKKMFASSAKAERELGFRVLPVEPALERAIGWFRANGYVAGAGKTQAKAAR
jgi:dihydroflavonol-4-reductase